LSHSCFSIEYQTLSKNVEQLHILLNFKHFLQKSEKNSGGAQYLRPAAKTLKYFKF